MKNIILIGMPSAGKSTVGVILAKNIKKDFLDTDVLIQKQQGLLLQDILDKFGTGYFIKAEQDAIMSLDVQNTVIATGGSVVYSHIAMEHLKRNGIIIYLKININSIIKRLNNINTRGIVLGKGQTLSDIYNERKCLYEKYADITVECSNLSISETVDEVLHKLEKIGLHAH